MADETRYMCMSRPIKPIIPVEEKPFVIDPLDTIENQRAKMRRKFR